jgi:hypothetical protein
MNRNDHQLVEAQPREYIALQFATALQNSPSRRNGLQTALYGNRVVVLWPVFLILIIFLAFVAGTPCAAQSPVSVFWSITATATESASSSGSSSIVNPTTQESAGLFGEKSFTPTYDGTLNLSWSISGPGPGFGEAEITVSSSSSYPPNAAYYDSGVYGNAHPPYSGSASVGITAGNPVYVGLWRGDTSVSATLNYSWSGGYSQLDSGYVPTTYDNMPFVGGTNITIGTYAVQWNGYKGGTITIDSFNFSGGATDPRVAGRLTVGCNPSAGSSGTVYANIYNTQPTATLVAPANGATVMSLNPTFSFTYKDAENDAQQALEVQISTNSTFSTLIFDSGRVMSSATSFTLPSANSLLPDQVYYWRVRMADILGSTNQWGNFSAVNSFTNVASPVISLYNGGVAIPQGGSYTLPSVNRGYSGNGVLIITNTGNEPLSVTGINATPAGAFFVIAPTNFPFVLAPNQATNLTINFEPTEPGLYSNTVSVFSSDPQNPAYVVSLYGNCIDAAFQYIDYLYSRSSNTLAGKLGNISDYWGDEQRALASNEFVFFKGMVAASPTNLGLRSELLDVLYDTSLAEYSLGQEYYVNALQLLIGVDPQPGDVPAINQEIPQLVQTLQQYQKAEAPYLSFLSDTIGNTQTQTIDPSVTNAMPFGYYIFWKDVPTRSLYSPLERDAQGDWLLPSEVTATSTPVEIYEGYKDLVLLLQIEQQRVETDARLAQLYLLRQAAEGTNNGYSASAASACTDALQGSYTEVQTLLGIFGISANQGGQWANLPSQLTDAVLAWRSSINEVTRYQSFLNGLSNPLGFPDNTLILIQSQIPGDPASQYFNSYDYLANYINDAAAFGPLAVASASQTKAIAAYQNYAVLQSQLASDIAASQVEYGNQLEIIVGAPYGTPEYDNPAGNPSGEIAQELLSIQEVQGTLTELQQEMANNDQTILDTINQVAQANSLYDAAEQVTITIGNEQASVAEETADLTAAGNQLNNPNSASQLATLGQLQGQAAAESARLAAEQSATVSLPLALGLLDANAAANIKLLVLAQEALYLKCLNAAIAIQVEQAKLSALYSQKATLEQEWNQANANAAASDFADPSYSLVKNNDMVTAELDFQNAQSWVYLTAKALEYKWNQPFTNVYEGNVYYTKKVFELGNAQELTTMFAAMADWNAKVTIGQQNSVDDAVLSMRDDLLDFPDWGPDANINLVAFQNYLATNSLSATDPNNALGPGPTGLSLPALRIKFNTVHETTYLFLQNRWLEKINFMSVKVLGGTGNTSDTTIPGYLNYGGTSYIRNQHPGTSDTNDPGELINEMTAYPVKYLQYDTGSEAWITQDGLGSSINVDLSGDPSVPPSAFNIFTFQQCSTATTEWTLYIALKDFNGRTLLDPTQVTDIQIHFNFYWYNRQ